MKFLKERVRSFLVNEDGPTATEYAVMLALIIVVAIAAISTLGERVNTMFTSVAEELDEAGGGGEEEAEGEG